MKTKIAFNINGKKVASLNRVSDFYTSAKSSKENPAYGLNGPYNQMELAKTISEKVGSRLVSVYNINFRKHQTMYQLEDGEDGNTCHAIVGINCANCSVIAIDKGVCFQMLALSVSAKPNTGTITKPEMPYNYLAELPADKLASLSSLLFAIGRQDERDLNILIDEHLNAIK